MRFLVEINPFGVAAERHSTNPRGRMVPWPQDGAQS